MSHTTKSYPLLVQENSAALTSVPGISTVTFYKENGTSRSSIFSTVSSQLEQRVSEIVAKNPWLSGSIHKDTGSKKMVLEVPAAGASNRHFTSISMDSSASPLASLGLTSATPYDKVCEMVQKHLPESLVPPARLLLGDTHKSLFRVTLVQLQG